MTTGITVKVYIRNAKEFLGLLIRCQATVRCAQNLGSGINYLDFRPSIDYIITMGIDVMPCTGSHLIMIYGWIPVDF